MPKRIKSEQYRRILDKLKSHYDQARPKKLFVGQDLPYVPPPSSAQPDPLIIGPQELIEYANDILSMNPYVKENVKSITVGPSKDTMDRMLQAGLPIDEFANTNLLGLFRRSSKGISINPGVRGDSLLERDRRKQVNEQIGTLVHELGHAAGYGETGAERGRDIFFGR